MAKEAPKASFNITEVSDLTGIKAHVLRYWETEFPQLKPPKGPSGQRVYKQKDVEVILRLKRLLYDEEYTISGARKKLDDELKGARQGQLPLEFDLKEAEIAGLLVKIKRQVAALREQLERPLPEFEGDL